MSASNADKGIRRQVPVSVDRHIYGLDPALLAQGLEATAGELEG